MAGTIGAALNAQAQREDRFVGDIVQQECKRLYDIVGERYRSDPESIDAHRNAQRLIGHLSEVLMRYSGDAEQAEPCFACGQAYTHAADCPTQ